MSTKVFVNLPVRDLSRSVGFFTKIGFTPSQQLVDEKAAGMYLTDDIWVMLLTEPFFQTFTANEIADTSRSTEVLVCIGVDSRQEVDTLADRALAAGGKPLNPPVDEDVMYGRSFVDPDGHHWEVTYMDPALLESE